MYGKNKKNWKAPTVLGNRQNNKLVWIIEDDIS